MIQTPNYRVGRDAGAHLLSDGKNISLFLNGAKTALHK